MAASNASNSEIVNENITCTICIDIFKDPRTLSCLHTFCCQCLQNYIDQQDDACQKKGFSCPVCREFIGIPNPTAGWAAQMEHDFRIEALSGGNLLSEDAEPSVPFVDISSKDLQFELIKTVDASSYANINIEECFIHDIVVLNQDGMEVFVISYKNTVKALWHDPSKDTQMKSSLVLDFGRSKLTKINERLIAVLAYKDKFHKGTFNSDATVMVVHVLPHLSVKAASCTLICKGRNFGIASIKSETPSASESRLVLGQDGHLVVTHLHGNFLKSISFDKIGKKLCETISDITTTFGNIIIARKNKVICVTMEGERLWEYHVHNPVIVHGEARSNVFVVSSNWSKDCKLTCKVILLSPEGTFVRDVLTEDHSNTRISGIFFDGYKGRLYVTIDNYIKIYECK